MQNLDLSKILWYNNGTELDGELAVPCTCNPLQQGWIFVSV